MTADSFLEESVFELVTRHDQDTKVSVPLSNRSWSQDSRWFSPIQVKRLLFKFILLKLLLILVDLDVSREPSGNTWPKPAEYQSATWIHYICVATGETSHRPRCSNTPNTLIPRPLSPRLVSCFAILDCTCDVRHGIYQINWDLGFAPATDLKMKFYLCYSAS